MKRHYLLLLLLLPLLLVTCRSSDDDMEPEGGDSGLPPITMEGAQTFGCLVNGEVFVNRPSIFDDNISMSYSQNFGDFNLSSNVENPKNPSPDTDFIRIYSHFSQAEGAQLEIAIYNNFELCTPTFLEKRDFPNEDENYLRISRLDNEEHIISGTFAFVVVDTICHDTFRITEGRFDYDYAN